MIPAPKKMVENNRHFFCILRNILILLSWFAFLELYPNTAFCEHPVTKSLHKKIKAVQKAGTHIGFWVQGVSDKTPFIAFQSDKKLPSASISKLFTAYAALALLGPNFKFKTTAFIEKAKLKNGVLNSTLLIKGYGDPFLVSERLWLFAEKLSANGIKHIKKGIKIDQSFFKDYPNDTLKKNMPRASSIPPYLAPVSPTAVNFNTIALHISRDLEKQSEYRVAALPFNDYVDVQFQGPSKGRRKLHVSQRQKYSGQNLQIYLKGQANIKGADRLYEAIWAPTIFFANVFKRMLVGQGVQVEGSLSEYRSEFPIEMQEGFIQISFDSLPLSELVRLMIIYSNNFMADSLVFAMGADGQRASYQLGKQRMLEWFKVRGITIDPKDFEIGSGLSRKNKVSARVVGQLLKQIWSDPRHNLELLSALPVAGQNGTLKGNHGWPLIRAKTGNMARTSNLAGVIYSAKHKPYLFALFLHNKKKKNYQLKKEINDLVKLLAKALQ